MGNPIKNKETLEKEWAEKGFSCDLWIDPPGQRWENYVHDVDEVVYVMEGALEFEIGGTTARWYYGYKNR